MSDVMQLTFVLITAARNEERLIEQTIRSVISQTVLPKRWVIVSDGSTDHTDEIIERYMQDYSWIELVRMPERRDRHFAAKVQCFNAGLEKVDQLTFDVIGNLDADITFDPDYFEFLLAKFATDVNLGVAGTPFIEGETGYDFRYTSLEHVSGACQMFRRECFEQIGGYEPVKGGGIDWIAVTTARMKGWKTRTFVERVCHHHRPMGTASSGKLKADFVLGKQDYYLGGHPIWQFFRGLYQMGRRPYVLGGSSLLAGFFWAWLKRIPRPVSAELIRFHRREQTMRLKQKLSRIAGIRSLDQARR
jgi:glycosyltransferase involved in cell wall biosynthesis